MSEAVAYAGVARSTAYVWAEDAEFEAAWVRAEGEAAQVLRRKAFEMAKGGNVRLLMWLLDRMEDRAEGADAGDGTEAVGAIEIIGLEGGERKDVDFITFVENEG